MLTENNWKQRSSRGYRQMMSDKENTRRYIYYRWSLSTLL